MRRTPWSGESRKRPGGSILPPAPGRPADSASAALEFEEWVFIRYPHSPGSLALLYYTAQVTIPLLALGGEILMHLRRILVHPFLA